MYDMISRGKERYKNAELTGTLHLLNTCNYSCWYCTNNLRHTPFGKGASIEGIDKIIEFFAKQPKIWDICLTGGEVTAIPHYIYLCENLTKKHSIQFWTNNSISYESQREFISKIDPNNVSVINCSLHLVDEADSRFNDFVKKVKAYKDSKFNVTVRYIGIPDRFNNIERYKTIFNDMGVRFFLQMYTGKYKEKTYPGAYNEKEREVLHKNMFFSVKRLLLDMSVETSESISEIEKRISTFGELWGHSQVVIDGSISTCGKSCRWGHTHVLIDGNTGTINGCPLDNDVLGNVYEGDIKLYGAAIHCSHKTCPCGVQTDDVWRIMLEEKYASYNDISYTPPESNYELLKKHTL